MASSSGGGRSELPGRRVLEVLARVPPESPDSQGQLVGSRSPCLPVREGALARGRGMPVMVTGAPRDSSQRSSRRKVRTFLPSFWGNTLRTAKEPTEGARVKGQQPVGRGGGHPRAHLWEGIEDTETASSGSEAGSPLLPSYRIPSPASPASLAPGGAGRPQLLAQCGPVWSLLYSCVLKECVDALEAPPAPPFPQKDSRTMAPP